VRDNLLNTIDISLDSLRVYTLRSDRDASVEVHGRDRWIDPDDPIVV